MPSFGKDQREDRKESYASHVHSLVFSPSEDKGETKVETQERSAVKIEEEVNEEKESVEKTMEQYDNVVTLRNFTDQE